MARWRRDGRARRHRPEGHDSEYRFGYRRYAYGGEYRPGRREYPEDYRGRPPAPALPEEMRRVRASRRHRPYPGRWARGWPGPEQWWHAIGPERRQDYDWAFSAGPPGRYGWTGETGHM